VRSTRIAAVLLLAFSAALLAGCSERASRLTGNERLLRGGEGLGTTFLSDTLVDMDTHVAPAITNFKGATLLVGRLGSYQARSLFRPSAWTLPDTTALIDTVRFRLEYDARVDQYLGAPSNFTLYLAGAAWDSTTVSWPGPPLGTPLGAGADSIAPFTVHLGGASAMTQVRAWAADPSFPGFVLTLDSGSEVRGFLAGTARVEIVYHTLLDPALKTVKTMLPTDLSIYTPAPPASAVADTLALGGLFQSEVLLHAPVALSPTGYSINGAAFVAYVASRGFATTDTSAEIRAYRLAAPWTEGAPTDSIAATPLTIIGAYRVRAPGDSIVIQVPVSLAIAWSQNPASNYGILLRVVDAIYAPPLALRSRESTQPPVLRVTRTTPPPGRF
jgi:hypothetical protein